MLVYEFMVPAAKVIKVTPDDTIETALDKIIDNHISAVVVMDPSVDTDKVAGIITKTDIAKAYKLQLPLTSRCERIMTKQVKTVSKSLQRDVAAKCFAAHKIHHAIVVGHEGRFEGFISAWDCAKEGSLDHQQALPWNRRMMGRRV